MTNPAFVHDADVFAEPLSASSVAFRRPRDFSSHRFIYTVISPRAGGLSIGVNLNPDRQCNFNCIYCEVDRRQPAANNALDIGAMAAELNQTLGLVCSAHLRSDPRYAHLPPDLTELRHVALSGDGEPTLSPRFAEAVRTIVRLRAQLEFPYFKLVLVTNASGLDQPEVKESLKLFDSDDEVWAKLDAGSHEYFDRINVPHISLSRVMGNILMLAQLRPVVIQSLFPLMDGEEPSANEIRAYVGRLQELTAAGAMISLVQVYSASRPIGNARCGHLRLRTLSRIAKLIRSQTGLPAEVF